MFFFFEQKTGYEICVSLVGSEMCIIVRCCDVLCCGVLCCVVLCCVVLCCVVLCCGVVWCVCVCADVCVCVFRGGRLLTKNKFKSRYSY